MRLVVLVAVGVGLVPGLAGAKPWAHVSTIDRCHIRLERAPKADQDRVRAAAVTRFGNRVAIELTPLGDRIASISGPIAPATEVAPADKAAAAERAHDVVLRHAVVLGIGDAVDTLKLRAARLAGNSGWLATGSVYRTVAGLSMSAGVEVAVDRAGAVTAIRIGNDLLPEFAICEVPTLDPNSAKVRRTVVDAKLSYIDDDGQRQQVTVGPNELRETNLRLLRIGDRELHRALSIQVSRGRHVWTFLIDGETGDLLRIDETFAPVVDFP